MSGRRSEPASLPARERIIDGRLHVGTDPWADCAFCGTVRDTAEFDACPVCLAEMAEEEREHWAAIAREYALDASTETVH